MKGPLPPRKRPRLVPVNDAPGCLECGFYIQRRRVEQVRIRRRFQGGDGPGAVALVPSGDFLQDRAEIGGFPPCFELFAPPPCPFLRRGGHEEFDVRVRAHDGADVASVENCAGRRVGDLALDADHLRPHFGMRRHDGCGLADLFGSQCSVGIHVRPVEFGRRDGVRFHSRIAARLEHRQSDRTIDGAGIEVGEAKVACELARQRSFSGCCRSIHRDNQPVSPKGSITAPTCVNKLRKVGKLVAIMLPSLIAISFSEASPMTRKDMAMRWSRWVSTLPPPSTRPPVTSSQSRPDAVLTPLAARPASTAASRSLSFTLSSSSPSMRVTPSAKAAATASTGYSSIIDGARSRGTFTPLSRLERADTSPTVSPPACRLLPIVMSAPISISVVRRPVRVGLSTTLSIVTSESVVMRAATIPKAAELGSAGTSMLCAVSS